MQFRTVFLLNNHASSVIRTSTVWEAKDGDEAQRLIAEALVDGGVVRFTDEAGRNIVLPVASIAYAIAQPTGAVV